jgi:hypothetical protein
LTGAEQNDLGDNFYKPRTQSFEWPELNGTIKINRRNSQEFQRSATRNMIDA